MCWAMKVGEWLHFHTPLKVKKNQRRKKSIFRYRLDHLRLIVNDLDIKYNQFLECLQFECLQYFVLYLGFASLKYKTYAN